MIKNDIEAVLFDLDNTLLDRKSTFSLYCDHLICTVFPTGISASDKPAIKQYMIESDKNGYEERAAFYEKVIQKWNLSCTAEYLHSEWRGFFVKSAVPIIGMMDILDYLSRSYKLGIITNGSSPTQNPKIDALGIRKFFDAIIISGDVGMDKPDKGIFLLACESLGVQVSKSVFIGDHYENDIVGATQAGLHAIWINETPAGDADYPYIVNDLASLRKIL